MHSREYIYFRVHFSANVGNTKENNLLYGYLYGVQQGIPFITKLKREIIKIKKTSAHSPMSGFYWNLFLVLATRA